MDEHGLLRSIERKNARIAVIGLGYVGIPVACMFARAGFDVTGVDVKANRIEEINAGISPIQGREPGLAELLREVAQAGRFQATTDYGVCRTADVVLLSVETPVDDETKKPHYEALRSALRSLGANLKSRTLIVVESTIAPGTMRDVVTPTLEDVSGLRANRDFHLVHCPERLMPGKLLHNIERMSRVVGGMTTEATELGVTLYRQIVKGDLDASDCITAELVKTAENAYRDVEIAFANELALICEASGGDVWKVRELVNKSPGRNLLLPGAGVGGHCIPKDPWLLAYAMEGRGQLRLIPAARAVNDSMPLHIADLTAQALRTAGREIAGSRIAVLGYAYLEDSDDTRNSPSEVLVSRLREVGAEVVIHDPWVPEYQGDLWERVGGCDAAIAMVAHSIYRSIDMNALKSSLRTPVVVDGRHVFQFAQGNTADIVYYSVGQGRITVRYLEDGQHGRTVPATPDSTTRP